MFDDELQQEQVMWIECESGNLINSDVVSEFAIIGPYDVEEEGPDGAPHSLYDLYAFNVGDVTTIHGPVFRDPHRYLVQHTDYETCDQIRRRLTEKLRNGARFFSAQLLYESILGITLRKKGIRSHFPLNGQLMGYRG
jgi:hypothetical protein